MEHQVLRSLFKSKTIIAHHLHQIETDLNNHARFEERVLFNEIQKHATPKQLQKIAEIYIDEKFVDNISDSFWES